MQYDRAQLPDRASSEPLWSDHARLVAVHGALRGTWPGTYLPTRSAQRQYGCRLKMKRR
jgi:hypothetical protein